MESTDTDVFFTGTLLGLDESGGTVDAHNQTTSDLWIQSTRMTSLLNFKNFLDPGHDLMRRWIGRFVEVDETIFKVFLQWTVFGGASSWDWRVVVGSDIKFVISL